MAGAPLPAVGRTRLLHKSETLIPTHFPASPSIMCWGLLLTRKGYNHGSQTTKAWFTDGEVAAA